MQFSTDIKIIWRYLRPFKSTARIILFLATIGAVLNAVIPLLYGRLVDMAINRSDWRLIAGFIVAWFVLSLISDALARGTDQLGDALSVRVSNSVLNFFMTHFIRLPISFHKNQKMGKLFSRMERAAYDLESIVADAIFSTAPGFLTAIVILVILFFVHWLLAVILLAVLVLYIAATVWRTGAIIVAQRQMHKIYDRAFDIIGQGGGRRSACMAILPVGHPDIWEFIHCKEKEGEITNFNISVGITDEFMIAVKQDKNFNLINPHDGKVWETVKARKLFDELVRFAHHNGEPGVVFLDNINRDNPVPHLYKLEATNPCAEQSLGPWENCCLASINLAQHVKEKARNSKHEIRNKYK